MEIMNQGFALKWTEAADASFSERLVRVSKPMPVPGPGQVLVKMLASPVNPSDLVYLRGQYGLAPKPDTFAGFEGCGVVVGANAGLYGKWLTGRRVAVAAQPGQDGVWAQYACTLASYCLPISDDLDDAQAATLIVNPCTVVCLLDRARALGARAVVINAAASQVGKGLIRYAQRLNIRTVATVRSEANLKVVRDLGATHALLTTEADFSAQLKAALSATGASVLLDAVAEKDTPRLLKQMPDGSTAILYGRLEETHDPLGGHFSVADVIFRDMRIEGFWLARSIKRMALWRLIQLNRKVQALFKEGVFHTDIRGQYGFDDFLPALEHYAINKSDGKVILCPWPSR